MAVRDPQQIQRSIESVENWRKLSDRLFQIGPLKVGLDGVLTWIPGVGDAYTLIGAGYLLHHAGRAGASRGTLLKMIALLGTDAVVGSIPIVGDAFDFVFRAHARSARILLKELNADPALAAAPDPSCGRPAAASPPNSDEQAQARLVSELRADAPR